MHCIQVYLFVHLKCLNAIVYQLVCVSECVWMNVLVYIYLCISQYEWNEHGKGGLYANQIHLMLCNETNRWAVKQNIQFSKQSNRNLLGLVCDIDNHREKHKKTKQNKYHVADYIYVYIIVFNSISSDFTWSVNEKANVTESLNTIYIYQGYNSNLMAIHALGIYFALDSFS